MRKFEKIIPLGKVFLMTEAAGVIRRNGTPRVKLGRAFESCRLKAIPKLSRAKLAKELAAKNVTKQKLYDLENGRTGLLDLTRGTLDTIAHKLGHNLLIEPLPPYDHPNLTIRALFAYIATAKKKREFRVELKPKEENIMRMTA